MERCPICKARLKDNISNCPRCSTDLSALLNIEEQARFQCYQAIMLLGAGHLGDAVKALEYSLQLKHEPLAQVLWGFIRYKTINW